MATSTGGRGVADSKRRARTEGRHRPRGAPNLRGVRRCSKRGEARQARDQSAKVRTARRRHLNGEQGAARELHLGARRDECRPGPGESAAASEESDGEHFGGFVGEGTAPRELATGRFV